MLVNILALVIVFGMKLPIASGNRLRSFVGFETQIARLMLLGHLVVAEPVVAEHEVVMRLQIFRIDRQHALQSLHRIGIFSLQEKNAAQIVERHAVARILRKHDLQMRGRLLVISGGLHQRCVEKVSPRQLRVDGQRLLKHGPGARHIAFLQSGAPDVDPSIGILRIDLGQLFQRPPAQLSDHPATAVRCRNRSSAANPLS